MRFSIYVESVLHRCVQRKRSVVHDLDLPQWITSVEGKEEKFFRTILFNCFTKLRARNATFFTSIKKVQFFAKKVKKIKNDSIFLQDFCANNCHKLIIYVLCL